MTWTVIVNVFVKPFWKQKNIWWIALALKLWICWFFFFFLTSFSRILSQYNCNLNNFFLFGGEVSVHKSCFVKQSLKQFKKKYNVAILRLLYTIYISNFIIWCSCFYLMLLTHKINVTKNNSLCSTSM